MDEDDDVADDRDERRCERDWSLQRADEDRESLDELFDEFDDRRKKTRRKQHAERE